MQYRITNIDSRERWIFIGDCRSNQLDETSFAALVKSIAASVHGTICETGKLQYRISNLPLDLVFQWDDLFGAVVIYFETDPPDKVTAFLSDFFS